MTTTTITKSLLESISKVVNSDSKNLTESYSYIDKKNNKASNTDQLEDLIAAELDLGGVDDEDLETMLDLFKKGYYIAVAVGAGTKRELKKDGYTLGNFAAYKDGDERTQEIYVKAPAGMKEEMTEAAAIPTNPSDFMDYFDDKYNSAAGMWLDKKRIPELMRLVNTKTVKTVMADADKEGEYEKTISKMKAKGFKLFDSEENVDSIDFIFYKDGKMQEMSEAAAAIPTNPSDFMDYFDDKYNSAAGMWLAKTKIPELMKLVKNKTIKTASGDADKEDEADKIISKMKAKGFKLFDYEENGSSLDFIFYK